ncbi:MAG: radical SAM family heme chaperone HemW [Prevotella sp.]|nr:radical SAM family heme chaperone HemW [Prevotella sp.]
MAGLYVHVPFCRSRCVYCGFYSTTLNSLHDRYIEALGQEMSLRRNYLGEPIQTIYIGGGTPSTLSDDALQRLFALIRQFVARQNGYKGMLAGEEADVFSGLEVTVECNPDDITPEKAACLRRLGVNRVSMGIQTFDDGRLRFIRRRHTARQAREAFRCLREHGFGNISIDLMFGFPNETADDWQRDIEEALLLEPEHISAYSLMIEEGTPLKAMADEGKIEETDEETSRAMFETLCTLMTSTGYEHYEISNFARQGFRSRHNSNYWRAVPYIGLGAAAHSYDGTSRQWNVDNIDDYINIIGIGKVPCERELLDTPTQYNDLMTTAMRTKEGVSLEYIEQKLGKKYLEYIMKEAEKFIDKGLLTLSDNRLSLSHEGIFISDSIISELIYA